MKILREDTDGKHHVMEKERASVVAALPLQPSLAHMIVMYVSPIPQ
jgi:hypothetical protein